MEPEKALQFLYGDNWHKNLLIAAKVKCQTTCLVFGK